VEVTIKYDQARARQKWPDKQAIAEPVVRQKGEEFRYGAQPGTRRMAVGIGGGPGLLSPPDQPGAQVKDLVAREERRASAGEVLDESAFANAVGAKDYHEEASGLEPAAGQPHGIAQGTPNGVQRVPGSHRPPEGFLEFAQKVTGTAVCAGFNNWAFPSLAEERGGHTLGLRPPQFFHQALQPLLLAGGHEAFQGFLGQEVGEFGRGIGCPKQVSMLAPSHQLLTRHQDKALTTMLEDNIDGQRVWNQALNPAEDQVDTLDHELHTLHRLVALVGEGPEDEGQLGNVARMDREVEVAE
jgi:hypothetical protein